jgi:hypothetical protein
MLVKANGCLQLIFLDAPLLAKSWPRRDAKHEVAKSAIEPGALTDRSEHLFGVSECPFQTACHAAIRR